MRIVLFTLLLFFITSANIFSQKEYVRADNPVYDFLQRMYEEKLIADYNSFQVPKTREEIAKYIFEIDNQKFALNKQDRGILNDLLIEFEYDIEGTLSSSQKIIGGRSYNLFSNNEKYLYYTTDNFTGNSFFVNLLFEGEGIFSSPKTGSSINSTLGLAGGEFRGTLANRFAFSLHATNGYAFGNKNAARLREELNYNYKFNEKPDERFFDNAEGYAALDFDAVRFKLGRDRLHLGYSENTGFFNQAPAFDYIGMDFSYSVINFSWFHGKIQGTRNSYTDSVFGIISEVKEKYIGYHRIGINITDFIQFGAGEFIIYGERPLEFAYLNPFNFYKSAEHSGVDRDNAMIFFDANAVLLKGLRIYSTILIDDIDFGKIGKSWYGNQTSFTAGLSGSVFYKTVPLNYTIEYQRTEPYVFTHRLLKNNFTHIGYPLFSSLPNSENWGIELSHHFTNRLFLSMAFNYSVHGANPFLVDGSVINVGGDLNLGHRIFDSESVEFLSGYKEYYRQISALLRYEPFNNIIVSYRLNYINNSIQMYDVKELHSFFNLALKF